MADKPVTLDVYCARCGGATTLQFETWPEPPVVRQDWLCPYCAERHHGYFPGRLAWAMKGHVEPPLI